MQIVAQPPARILLIGQSGKEASAGATLPAFGIADGKNKTSIYTRRIIFNGKAEVASATGQ